MPAVCLLEARLEASDVGFLVREAHPCGGGLVGGRQVGVPKRRPALWGLLLCGVALVCWVEECAEWELEWKRPPGSPSLRLFYLRDA